MKELISIFKELWWFILFLGLVFAWAILYAYADIKAKWNIAHLKNCPCLVEAQK